MAEKTESERPNFVEVDDPGLKFTVQDSITWNASKMDSSIVMKGNGLTDRLSLLTVRTIIQSKIRIRVRSELMG